MTTAADVRSRLAAMAHPEGGWGYSPGQPAHLEPTCHALAALAADAGTYAAQIEAGKAALERNRQADATYRLQRGRPQAVWPTSLALIAKYALSEPLPTATVEKLLTVEGKVLKKDPEVADMTDIDLELLGWPWGEGTFSWVEPTSWACVALRAAGKGDHARVREGLRLLLDRAFDEGGANYGNRRILGRMTEPMPGPTAALLLALQGVDHPRVAAAKGYLRMQGAKSTDLENLAWAKIALSAHANDMETRDALPEIDRRVVAALAAEPNAGPGRVALAAIALDAPARLPFRLLDPPQVGADGDIKLGNAAAAAAKDGRGFAEKIGAKFRGFMVNGLAAMRALPATSAVHIGVCETYDDPILAVLKDQFAQFKPHLPPVAGKRVVLKPNLVEYHRDKVINTDPRFVDAVIQLFQAEGAAEIVVAEGPGHYRNLTFLVNESGLGEVLAKHGVRFVDINHDEPVKELNLGRTTGLEYLFLSKTVTTADLFVSLPKLKTHHWAGATLSLKNLFGTLPGICYGWPKNELHWRGIPNSIVDIALTQTPHLAIVDGIVGMEGDGPLNGTAKPMGVLVMGVDLLAVDATCCRLMGLPPERVPTLRLGESKRLGRLKESEITQLGAAIADRTKAFVLPPKIEMQLVPAGQ